MRGPDIIKSFAAGFVNLSEQELLVTLGVKHHIEGTGGRAFKPSVKAGLRVGRQPIKENAKGVVGIHLSNRGIPLRSDGSIRLSRKIGGAELAEKLAGSIVRKSEVTVDEFLIEDGSAEKTPHLLLFDRIARGRQNVTAPGKDCAGDLSIEREEKGEPSIFKRENGIAAAQLDVIGGSDAIDI
jgi:hypothetical protein